MINDNIYLFFSVDIVSLFQRIETDDSIERYYELDGVSAFKLARKRTGKIVILECLPHQQVYSIKDLALFLKPQSRLNVIIIEPGKKIKQLLESEYFKESMFIQIANHAIDNETIHLHDILLEDILIKHENHLREQKNKNEKDTALLKLQSSIDYAKRLQDGLFVKQEVFEQVFPDSFIFDKPKETLSGDFLWFTIKRGEKLIILCDCTGHGVPGALLTMLGNSIISNIVSNLNITEPFEIINHLSHEWSKLFNHQNRYNINDGMAIAICKINTDKRIIHFASSGAFIIYTPSQGAPQELITRKQSIGFFNDVRKLENNILIKYNPEDNIYMFSDGFTDQLGGANGSEKFSRARLKLSLENLKTYPMKQQEYLLKKEFLEWKASLPQIDDILITGIKL